MNILSTNCSLNQVFFDDVECDIESCTSSEIFCQIGNAYNVVTVNNNKKNPSILETSYHVHSIVNS